MADSTARDCIDMFQDEWIAITMLDVHFLIHCWSACIRINAASVVSLISVQHIIPTKARSATFQYPDWISFVSYFHTLKHLIQILAAISFQSARVHVTAWIAISDIITFLESFEYPIAAVGIQIVNYPLLSLDRS